ncbi:MAG: tetratricopeptide repeat protein [Stellaceae bacterium]
MVRAAVIAIGLCLAPAGAAHAADPAPDAAIVEIKRAIADAMQRAGAASPALLPLYRRLARLQFTAGDLDAATTARRRNLTITLHLTDGESLGSAKAMIALADAELDQLHYFDAEGMLIIAGNIIEGTSGAKAVAQVPVLAGLGRISLARGDLVNAEAQARRAVMLRAENPHPRSSEALRVLGAIFAGERKFDEGAAILEQAVAFDRAQHGAEDPETARSLSQLGNLYLRADRFTEALRPLEEAAAIDQARLARDHPFIADDLHDIAIADEGLKRQRLAHRLLTTALALLRNGSERNRTRIALCELDLSRIDRALGDSTAADATFRRARRLLDAAQKAERDRERNA